MWVVATAARQLPEPQSAALQNSARRRGFDPNPFSAAHLRPQRNEYLFPDAETTLADVAERFLVLRHRQAAIVGPHGTGKSTLAAGLVPILSQHYHAVAYWVCRNERSSSSGAGQRLTRMLQNPHRGETLVVLDGFERLAAWQRWHVLRIARRQRIALLLTLHRPALLLPTLYRTFGQLDVCQRLVQRHLEPYPDLVASMLDRLDQQWPEFRGNTREALFAMYDAFEQLRRTHPVHGV